MYLCDRSIQLNSGEQISAFTKSIVVVIEEHFSDFTWMDKFIHDFKSCLWIVRMIGRDQLGMVGG